MEPTYENVDNKLKIVVPVEESVSLEELQAEKAQVENDIANCKIQYQANMGRLTNRLDSVNEKLQKATDVGVIAAEPDAESSEPNPTLNP